MTINLSHLNKEQHAAVIASQASTLVLAGAGTGKTTVLTHRAAYLTQDAGVKPSSLIAVTFTNKAATELRERLSKKELVGEQQSKKMWIGTFHSLCRKMLAENGVSAGVVQQGFNVIDQDSAVRLIRQERARMKEAGLLPTGTHEATAKLYAPIPELIDDDGETEVNHEYDSASAWDKDAGLLKPDSVIRQISAWKQAGVSVSKAKEELKKQLGLTSMIMEMPDYGIPATLPKEALSLINTVWHYERYQEELAADKFLDFEDLLDKGVELLGHPVAGKTIREQFSVGEILVDEFQDTNDKQYEWLMRLADIATPTCNPMLPAGFQGRQGRGTPIFAVGDDSQSIYSFRGSNPEYMQSFLNDVARGNIVKLEQNYRSSPHILDIANNVISKNSDQIEKTLRSGIPAPVSTPLTPTLASLDMVTGNYDEAHHIVYGEGGILHRRSMGVPYSDMAVMYRTNMQGAPIEKSLREAGVPYVVYGGYSFYQRESVQTALAALKLVVAPDNDTYLRRIIGLKDGIGEKAVAQLVQDRDNDSSASSIGSDSNGGQVQVGSLDLFGTALSQPDTNTVLKRPTFTVKDEVNGGNIKDTETGKDLRVTLPSISPELLNVARQLTPPGSRKSLFATGKRPADMRQLKAQDAFADLASCIGGLYLSAKDIGLGIADSPLVTSLDLALDVLGINDYYSKQDEVEKLEEGGRHTDYLTELRAHAANFEAQVAREIELEQIETGNPSLTGEQRRRLMPENLINAWIDQINLESSKQESYDASPDKLSLMTIHAAKGLEFDSAYVCGVVEGVFPHKRAAAEDEANWGTDKEGKAMAEERRLFYVALTRAKKHLLVSGYTQSYNPSTRESMAVGTSSFLYEIPNNKVVLADRRRKTHKSQELPELELANMGGYTNVRDRTVVLAYGGSGPMYMQPDEANQRFHDCALNRAAAKAGGESVVAEVTPVAASVAPVATSAPLPPMRRRRVVAA